MSTTVRDASMITRQNRDAALYAYASNLQNQVNAGTSIKREQPTSQTAVVILQRNLGACVCAQYAQANPYSTQGPGPCGCGK